MPYFTIPTIFTTPQVYRDGQEIAEMVGDLRLGVVIRGQLTRVLADMGRFEEAEEFGLSVVARGEQLGQVFMAGMSKISMSSYHINREQWAEAVALLDAVSANLAGSDANWFPLYAMPMLAAAHYGLADLEMAQKLAEESYQAALTSKALTAQADTQRIMAQVLFSQENYDLALEKVNAAIAITEQENSRLSLGRALVWKAKILAAQGDAKAAKQAAAQAEELFQTCGALPDLERVQAFSQGLG